MVFCVLAQAGPVATEIPDPAAFLDRTESLRTKDHPQFLQMLEQIHREAPRLDPAEQWHLRYLDAWESMFQGDYAKSEAGLQDIIDHSGNPTLTAKASAMLMGNLGINRRYSEAFALSHRLTSELPRIKDRLARFTVLMNLSQMLNLAGQTDLAIKYAHMMEAVLQPGESNCYPLSMQAAALYNSKRLTSSSPELQQAIDTCVGSRQPIVANSMKLTLSSLYLEENHPEQAMSLLDQIEPGIKHSRYYPHMLSAQVQSAQAFEKLGRNNRARQAALAAVAMSSPGEISEFLREAYEVLYEVEKKSNNAAAALAYHEHYVAQDKGYLDDVSARALAYQMAQQQVLTEKLEAEELSKQNSILRLQRALDTKAVEASRLYIALLLVTLAFIVFWLYRLKRSQLRFMRLSRCDGLTGIFNHQHFISEAERALRQLERKPGLACLISIDLDHFKQVNDTHGHAMGDAVLQRTVAVCKQHLRPLDLFGRLGGEEFGILLYGCSRDQGMDIAERIRIAIGTTTMEHDEHGITVSASVGLASTDVSGYELQRLCMEADAALYRAKRAGRNRVIADTAPVGLANA